MGTDLRQIESWFEQLDPFTAGLHEAMRASILRLTDGVAEVVGIGMLSDADASTLAPVAETRDHLAGNRADHPELAVFYAWTPDEWGLQPDAAVAYPTDAIMERLRPIADRVRPDDRVEWTTTVCNWVVDGLHALVVEGWFDRHVPGANVMFWVTDSDEPPENLAEWAETIDPSDRTAAYVDWVRRQ